jgi:hypothetical protein
MKATERMSLRELVDEIAVTNSLTASSRNIELLVTPVAPGVDIEGDRQLLAAALANIVQNACKSTPSEGRVSVKTSATRDRVIIDVVDQCGGLPPGKAEELSLPVQHADGEPVGLGLGLSISRRSIAASGGHIRVRDVPGIGCIFTVDLPRLGPAP